MPDRRRRTTRLERGAWSVIDAIAPPQARALEALSRKVAAITARRLRRVERALLTMAARPDFRPGRRTGRPRRHAGGPATRARGRGAGALAALVATTRQVLAGLPEAGRRRLLTGPDLRGFLSEAEIWIGVLQVVRDPGRAPTRLFDIVSRTEHLATLVPTGRADAGFPARAAALARRRLAALESDLGAFLLGLRLAQGAADRPIEVALRAEADPEQGRPAGRIDLGTFGGPAGALGIIDRRGDGGRRGVGGLRRNSGRRRESRRWLARIERGLLSLRAPGRPMLRIAAAGSTLATPHEALVRRRVIPGSAVLLAPALRSSPHRLGVGGEVPGLERRLAAALRLVRLAWPEAHRDLATRTAMVVPVREPGLVSYSLAARPGISFINVHGKRLVQLADDLLHENAHHLLHDIEEAHRLVAEGPDTEEVQAFHSPWRGALRPLRGILHGTFTFLFRAELFARILEVHDRRRRLVAPLLGRGGAGFVRRERAREMRLLRRGLADLRTAAAERLLTPAGRRLAGALGAWHRRLGRRRARRIGERPARGDS